MACRNLTFEDEGLMTKAKNGDIKASLILISYQDDRLREFFNPSDYNKLDNPNLRCSLNFFWGLEQRLDGQRSTM